jgi:hypothetical protein
MQANVKSGVNQLEMRGIIEDYLESRGWLEGYGSYLGGWIACSCKKLLRLDAVTLYPQLIYIRLTFQGYLS